MFVVSLGRMEIKKQKIKVAALSCLAVLATAPAASAGLYGPYESEPEKKKPAQPEFPAPVDGAIEGVPVSTLETIAACESGGDPQAVNAAGYYGKYQFDTQTWAAVGGSGNPAKASEAEQNYRAALLYAQSGSSPWPVCGV